MATDADGPEAKEAGGRFQFLLFARFPIKAFVAESPADRNDDNDEMSVD